MHEPRFECHVCDPHVWLPIAEMLVHFRVEHDIDIEEDVAKWPDGEWVVVDTTLEPEDFA